MDKHHHEWQSLIWVLHENFLDQVLVLVSAAFLELDVAFDNLASNLNLISTEWRSAMDQFIEQNTERPNVDLMVMGFRCNHLGSHILECAAERIPLLIKFIFLVFLWSNLSLYAPSEVANLENIV